MIILPKFNKTKMLFTEALKYKFHDLILDLNNLLMNFNKLTRHFNNTPYILVINRIRFNLLFIYQKFMKKNFTEYYYNDYIFISEHVIKIINISNEIIKIEDESKISNLFDELKIETILIKNLFLKIIKTNMVYNQKYNQFIELVDSL